MANLANMGQVIGRATKNPAVYPNKDGSRKIMLTVAATDNFASGADKKKQTRYVPLEAFVRADKQGNGVYDLIHEGDLIAAAYSVRNNNFEKDGVMQYGIVLNIEDVTLLESKAVTDARQASKVAAASASEDEVPVE